MYSVSMFDYILIIYQAFEFISIFKMKNNFYPFYGLDYQTSCYFYYSLFILYHDCPLPITDMYNILLCYQTSVN